MDQNSDTMTESKRFPLHSKHVDRGARLGHFGAWEVPLYYTSILEEHAAVRTKAGVFDISHMGEFVFSGQGAAAFLDSALPRPIGTMKHGKALYMPMLDAQGGIVDDIIVYRQNGTEFLIIVNAANIDKDYAHLRACLDGFLAQNSVEVDFHNISDNKGLLALQGPLSQEIIEKALGPEFGQLKYYTFQAWESGMVARTGYTGEDGFEIMVSNDQLEEVWNRLFEAGESLGLVPIGFGARDTLRLEAGMLLYGHDMDEAVTPLEAGIGWAIKLDKDDFLGKSSVLSRKEAGVSKKLIGFEMIERGIPRQDYDIQKSGAVLGKVTSGSFSPTFKKNIGLGYVAAEHAEPGTEIDIMIRDKVAKAKVVPLPFYKRQR